MLLQQAHSARLCIRISPDIRNVDVDAGKLPTHWRKYQTRMKIYAESLELPTYMRNNNIYVRNNMWTIFFEK